MSRSNIHARDHYAARVRAAAAKYNAQRRAAEHVARNRVSLSCARSHVAQSAVWFVAVATLLALAALCAIFHRHGAATVPLLVAAPFGYGLAYRIRASTGFFPWQRYTAR